MGVSLTEKAITELKTLMTREQLAAAGLTVNEHGQLVNADGEIVDPADVVVAH